MAIYLDRAIDYHGKFKGCSHLVSNLLVVSNLLGEEGTRELIAFATRIGMRREWLQHAGRNTEHFNVFGSRRPRAIKAGAVELGWRGLGRILCAKKRGEVYTPSLVEGSDDL